MKELKENMKYGSNPELDELVNDEYWGIRAAVAQQGYGLDKLIDDEHWFVRAAVAQQGYGLDKLIKDIDSYVRDSALKYF